MKIGIGTSFVLALGFHGVLLATLALNVSLEKPSRPEEKAGQIMHATIINMPPAKGSPQGTKQESVKVQDTAKAAAEAAAKRKAEAEAKAKEELAKQVAAQKKAEAERQKALALKKAQEEKLKKEAEAKKKAEEEAKKKAEAEAKKRAEAEAKKKAEAEAKKKAEEEAKRKAAEEAKKKAAAEAEAKRKAEEEAKRIEAEQLAQLEQANNIEDEIFGRADGIEGGQGLGSGDGSSDSVVYGTKVQQLIEQNWRIDPSMNGKQVIVTVSVDANGMIFNEKCQGDDAVCGSALSTLRLIGMLPMPPKGCKDCNTIVITMTPRL